MRPSDTWHVTFALSGSATGTPTAKLLHNGVADTTVGSSGTLTATAGADTNEWQVSVTIPASGYSANDTLEISATATVSGTTASQVVARAYIDPPVSVAGDIPGKVLGGGSGTITGVGANINVVTWLGGTPNALQTGRIDVYMGAVNPALGYDGLAQGGSGTTIQLASTASSVDNAYKNFMIRTVGGTGPAQGPFRVTGYVGSTKTATVAGTFSPTPDSTTTYIIDAPQASNVYSWLDVVPLALSSQLVQATGSGGGSAPTVVQIRQEMDTNSTQLAALRTGVIVTSNSDKTGYSLTTSPPTASTITTAVVAGMATAPVGSVTAPVTASTVTDKTGYSLTPSPESFTGTVVSATTTQVVITRLAGSTFNATQNAYAGSVPRYLTFTSGANQGIPVIVTSSSLSGSNLTLGFAATTGVVAATASDTVQVD